MRGECRHRPALKVVRSGAARPRRSRDRLDARTTRRYSRAILGTLDNIDTPCVGPGIRSRPDRTRGPRVGDQMRTADRVPFVSGRRFVRCHIRIVASTASIADRSSYSPQVSRSSTHSVASARHPSGVRRVALRARLSATGSGGPRAREGARTTGTGRLRGDTEAAAAGTPTGGLARCSRQRAPIAVGPHRCRSSRPGLARSIAAIAFRRVADDTRPRGRVSPRTGSRVRPVVRRWTSSPVIHKGRGKGRSIPSSVRRARSVREV